MKRIQIFIILLFQILLWQNGIWANSNFYIEIGKTNIEVGEYLNKKIKKKNIVKFKKDELKLNEISKILLADSSENILFYFHSMWGGVKIYHSNSLKKMNRISGIDKIVSIIWHTDKLAYKGSWEESIKQGQAISQIINSLTSHKKNNYFVLCHSMGHRIFEGVIKDLNQFNSRFRAIIFAAADLDINVFLQNLSYLPSISDKIVIYVNEKDRLLKLSKMIHKRDRLGLNAPKYISQFAEIENLEIVDITQSKKGNRFLSTNHIYFKKNKAVLRDIEFVINGKNKDRKLYFKKEAKNYNELL